ncbi:MAG: SCO family protein [Actinobacteria bacterium]|nr:SCO family protein [Actinomycetota bacterium]
MRRLALVAVVAVLAGCGGSKPSFDGTSISTPAPSFTLSDQSGSAVTMRAQRGRYAIVTFLYTHCPDVCPVIAGALNRVLQTPVAKRAKLRVLAISVDPKGDTHAAVVRFVREHRLLPAFRYLTGTRAELRPVWTAFHIASTPGPSGTVSHSAFEILVDPKGRERLIYDSNVTTAEVLHDLNELVG